MYRVVQLSVNTPVRMATASDTAAHRSKVAQAKLDLQVMFGIIRQIAAVSDAVALRRARPRARVFTLRVDDPVRMCCAKTL